MLPSHLPADRSARRVRSRILCAAVAGLVLGSSAAATPVGAQTSAETTTTVDPSRPWLVPSSSLVTTTSSTSTTTTSTTTTMAPTTTTRPPFHPGKVLKVGSRGETVLAMEERLDDLRYDVGKVDGRFDQQTWQGLVAFQKYEDIKRTGTFNLETQEALHDADLPEGVVEDGELPRIEVDITRQVLLYFDADGLNRVVAVSTGSGRNYCEMSAKSGKKVCGNATTPRGDFEIQRRIPGWRESDLGKLYNPLYFTGGFAIHGAPSVPAYPASHGCVRISVTTSNWFYSTVENGTPVYVFD